MIVGLLLLAATPAPLAIVGGRVLPVSGPPIEVGTVLIRGELIEAVGPSVVIPPGAELIHAEGRWVTPGLIESHTQLGVHEISALNETVDASVSLPEAIHAALRMEDGINPRSALIPVARRHGLTTAIVTPTGGLISGRSAWLDLGEPAEEGGQYFGPVAMNASLGEVGASLAGSSRAMAVMRLAEVLDDARLYKKRGAAFEQNGLRKLAASRLDLEALQDVIERRIPLVIEARRASDILVALRLAAREQLRPILYGADEGWLVAGALAKAGAFVAVNPESNLPGRMEQLGARPDNAAILAQAGVKLILTTESTHNASSLRFFLGNAVRAGLSPAVALEAATLGPATAFGQKDRYGALEKGRVANVVVWTGDPFEPKSFAEVVVIRGRREPLETRQTKLRQKYQSRLGL